MTISVRKKRTPAGGTVRGRGRKAGIGVLLLLSLFAGLIGFAPSASAHHANVSATVECGYKVNWKAWSWTDADGSGDNANVAVEYRLNGSGDWTLVQNISFDVPTNPDFDPHEGSFTAPGTPTSVEVRVRVIANWGNGTAGGQIQTTSPKTFPTDCAKPTATAQLVCAENKITVNFTGVGAATTVDIRKNGDLIGDNVPVPVGASSYTVNLVAADENTTVTIGLDYAGAGATDQSLQVPVNCKTPPNPAASLQWECGSNATVSLTNSGQESATATILKNGNPVAGLTNVAIPGVYQVPITGADEDTTVTITVDFSGTTSNFVQQIPVDCDHPEPTIGEPVCAEGGVSITLGNVAGEDEATFTISVNGVPQTPVVVPAGGSQSYLVSVAEDATVDISITSGNVSKTWDDYKRDCQKPGATLSFSCAAGGVVVDLTNTGTEATTINVAGTNHSVGAGGSKQVIVPVAEGASYSVTVTGGGGLNKVLEGIRDCEELSGSVVFDCAEGGVVISVTNTGEITTNIQINGGAPIAITPGNTYDATIPVAEGASYEVTVTGDGFNESASGTRNCEELDGTVAFECAEGGVAISVTNTGDITTNIQVNGGAPIAITPGNTYNATIPVAEGATYDVTVTGDGFTQNASGTRNCEELSGSVVFECAEGGVAISVTNTGEITTSISVNGGAPIAITPGNTYNATIPVDEGATYDVTVTGDGFNESASGTRDCEELSGSVVFECAEGGVVISVTNTGEITTSISVNGGAPIAITPGNTYNATVPVAEGATYDVTVTGDGFNESASGTRDCEELDGTAVFECAEGGVVVSVTNNGDLPTSLQINGGTPIEIAVGDTYTTTIPVAEGADYSVTITGEGLDESTSGTRDCEQPAVGSANLECAEGGVVVALTNDGELDAIVLVDGIAVNVPAGTSAEDPLEVLVPVDENAAYDFTVVGDGLDQSFSGVADCLLPEPTVDDEVVCAADGLEVVLRNTGDDTATYVITSPALPGGEAEETVDADDVETVLIPLEEGESTDVLVTSGDDTLFDATITRDCETVGGVQVPPAPLPRTGANTFGLLGLAGALLLAGYGFITGARRREAVLS